MFNRHSPACSLDFLPVLVLSVLVMLAAASSARALGPNLLGDAGFETGGTPGPWTFTGGSFAIVAGHAHSGAFALKDSLADNSDQFNNGRQAINLWYADATHANGYNYTTSVWVRGSGSGTVFAASPGASGDTWIASKHVVASAKWHRVLFTWDAGKNGSVVVGFQNDPHATGTIYLDDFYLGNTDGKVIGGDPTDPTAPGGFVPDKPGSCGFAPKPIFDDEFDSASTIDVHSTGKDGYKWYTNGLWFGNTTPNMWALLPTYEGAKGVLQIKDAATNISYDFDTTVQDPSAPHGYRGTVFAGGKGIYFEVRLACANLSTVAKNGWPGVWIGDAGPYSFTPDHFPMPGHPGAFESIENDLLEINPTWNGTSDVQWYSYIHDWNSGSVGNIGNSNAVIYMPSTMDFTQWHTYGQLYVPATAANGWFGYRQVFFDGHPEQAVCWIANQVSPTVDPSGSYLFSVSDGTPDSPPRWKGGLMLGGAQGGLPTVYFDYVRVWAVSPKESMMVVTK